MLKKNSISLGSKRIRLKTRFSPFSQKGCSALSFSGYRVLWIMSSISGSGGGRRIALGCPVEAEGRGVLSL